MTPQEREELLAAYALGGLSGADASAVEDLARNDASAARQLAEYQEVADLIALDAPLRRADPLLRARVLRAARQEEHPGRRRFPILRTLAAAAVIAALVVSAGWALRLQGELDTLRQESAVLQAAVISDSRRIDVLDRQLVAGGDEALRAELNRVRDTQQRIVAILADPDVWTAELASAEGGHGASGRCVWSATLQSGVLIAQGLPPLPLGTLYEVWLDDGERLISVGLFLPSTEGEAQMLIELDSPFEPRSVTVATAPAGGADSLQPPIVLSGDVER